MFQHFKQLQRVAFPRFNFNIKGPLHIKGKFPKSILFKMEDSFKTKLRAIGNFFLT